MARKIIIQLFVLTVLLTINPLLIAQDSPFPGERGEKLDTFSRRDIWQKGNKAFLARFVKVPLDW